MNILYLTLFAIVLRGTMETRHLLKSELAIARASDTRQLYPALLLKHSLMTRYLYLIIGYFSYEVIINGLFPTLFISDSSSSSSQVDPYEGI